MGATDVCPFIPVSNVSWEEAIACAKELGKRVGEELKIPVYLYEKAAKNPERSNLSIIRAGEYEGFFEKIKEADWKPDFGPSQFQCEIGRDGDWRAGIPGRLQCEPEHQSGETSELRRLRCAQKTAGSRRWMARQRENRARRKRRAGPRSRNAETCEGDWLVCGGIWDRAGLDESDEY